MIHTIAPDFFQHYYPAPLISSILSLEKLGRPVFLAGGAVRDLLLGRRPFDLDLTVSVEAIEAARYFASILKGKFLLLDEEEEVARVVWRNFCIDFTSFREKTDQIEADLRLRDFTFNALALPFRFNSPNLVDLADLIDPCGGLRDLKEGVIKQTHEGALNKDPARILRAYRFLASIGRIIETETISSICKTKELLRKVAAERLSAELHKIMGSPKAHETFALMADSSVLTVLFPEMTNGQNVRQPGSHHLDVFRHNLAALGEIEKIIDTNGKGIFSDDDHIQKYLADEKRRDRLKWAAFFHDMGKPAACKLKEGRITFYGHDNHGANLFAVLARRLKWGRRDTDQIALLIKRHMWLFHLNNARSKTGIKARACLKIHKALGEELPGLYLLSMADSLAAQGPDKPEGMEEKLEDLYVMIRKVIKEKINPVLTIEPVLNGKDLIRHFQLDPGPIFGRVLSLLEREQVVNGLMTREKALEWVGDYLQKKDAAKVHLSGQNKFQ